MLAIEVMGARLAPYSEAILPGATPWVPVGLAALTNPAEAVVGGRVRLGTVAMRASRTGRDAGESQFASGPLGQTAQIRIRKTAGDLAAAKSLALGRVEESRGVALHESLGEEVTLAGRGTGFQEINARPGYAAIGWRKRNLLAHDWREIAVEGQKKRFKLGAGAHFPPRRTGFHPD